MMSPVRKRQTRVPLAAPLLVGIMGTLSGCEFGIEAKTDPLLHAVMEAEDARGQGPAGLDPLMEGIQSSHPAIQQVAVRGLGRLEDPSHIQTISALLSSETKEVRAEAANALGQAVFNGPGDEVGAILQTHLPGESDPDVRGAIGRTLGRLSFENPIGLKEAETTLLEMTSLEAGDAPFPTLMGAVMGLEWMARRNRGIQLTEPTLRRLEALTSFGLSSSSPDEVTVPSGPAGTEGAARLRRTSLMALTAARATTPETIQRTIQDPDPDVRRLAIVAVGRGSLLPGGWPVLDQVLADPNPRVRTQALTALGTQVHEGQRCARLLSATKDPDTKVATGAMDLLARRCPVSSDRIQTLVGFIGAPEASSHDQWHRGAHALVALAALSPRQALEYLDAFSSHSNPFARRYAAQAAAAAEAQEVLVSLTRDPVPNVRTSALQGLFRLRGHEMDDILRDQLGQSDPQLLQTVAGLLRNTPNPQEALPPLVEAFHRLSSEGKETVRDPRMAILDRIEQVGGVAASGALEPYLSDYDPLVAARVATFLTDWTGQPALADPQPAPRAPVPAPAKLRELAETRFFLVLEGGGEIELKLLPLLAPTNAARFSRLARSGYFDGLTFHRVVPNFVLQGGSPAANEMAGDGPYARDEIGLQSNWRGTVGISSRGRDTGDGQIFVNLVDNLRLDHNYTIFAEIVDGIDVADRVVEGQVIEGVKVITF